MFIHLNILIRRKRNDGPHVENWRKRNLIELRKLLEAQWKNLLLKAGKKRKTKRKKGNDQGLQLQASGSIVIRLTIVTSVSGVKNLREFRNLKRAVEELKHFKLRMDIGVLAVAVLSVIIGALIAFLVFGNYVRKQKSEVQSIASGETLQSTQKQSSKPSKKSQSKSHSHSHAADKVQL